VCAHGKGRKKKLTKVQWCSFVGAVVVLGLVAFGAYYKGKVDAAGGRVNDASGSAAKTSLFSDPAQQVNGSDSSQPIRSSDPAQQARIQHLKEAFLGYDQKCVQPEKQIDINGSLSDFSSSLNAAVDPVLEDAESLTKLVNSSDPADVQAAQNDSEVQSADAQCVAISKQRSAAHQRATQALEYAIQEQERKNAINSRSW